MSDCSSKIGGGVSSYSQKPFVVFGQSTNAILFSFETLLEAKDFIDRAAKAGDTTCHSSLYGFAQGKWQRV
jgi:hypothetical protein